MFGKLTNEISYPMFSLRCLESFQDSLPVATYAFNKDCVKESLKSCSDQTFSISIIILRNPVPVRILPMSYSFCI